MTVAPARELSIVVAAWCGPAALARCLSAVLADAGADRDEIIVVRNYPPAGTLPTPVRDIERPVGTTVPRLRDAGLRAATGRIVAFIEDHAAPRPGWRDAIAGAFGAGVVASGGPVDATERSTSLGDAVYLYDYARFAPPLPSGSVDRVSGANMAFDRATLLEIIGTDRGGVAEPALEQAIRLRGQRFAFAADATVVVSRVEAPGRASSLAFHLARGFGASRGHQEGPWRGVLRLAAFPLVALLLACRAAASARRTGRWGGRLLRAAPWLLLLEGAWALGEGIGAVAGAGRSGEEWR